LNPSRGPVITAAARQPDDPPPRRAPAARLLILLRLHGHRSETSTHLPAPAGLARKAVRRRGRHRLGAFSADSAAPCASGEKLLRQTHLPN